MPHPSFRKWQTLVLVIILGVGLLLPKPGLAVTPQDPEVQRRVRAALKYLGTSSEDRLGGLCLVALCFKKADVDDHPKIAQAIERCYKTTVTNEMTVDNYSLGIALMLMCEVDPKAHHDMIVVYLEEIIRRQKPNGGWGYRTSPLGDTSQTQYAILGLWMAKKLAHINIPMDRVEGAAGWLMRTQDPSGAWGYQGQDAGSLNRVPQSQVSTTLAASGAGQLYMAADLLQVTHDGDAPAGAKPNALQDIVVPGKKKEILGPLTTILRPAELKNSLLAADRYLGVGFKTADPDQPIEWVHYYMYALERYHSFREKAGGGGRERKINGMTKGLNISPKHSRQMGVGTEKITPPSRPVLRRYFYCAVPRRRLTSI